MTRYTRASHGGQAGFTLVEVLIVAGLIAVVAAMTLPVTDQFIRSSKQDSSALAAAVAVDAARDRAVAERRNVVMNFVSPNRIQLIRQNINDAGTVVSTTTVDEFVLENGMQIYKFPGASDTPDAFGATSATSFSGTAPVMFTSDGTLIDSNGDVVNGTLFLGIPGQASSARALTIFGVTGFTRTWKWSGTQWRE